MGMTRTSIYDRGGSCIEPRGELREPRRHGSHVWATGQLGYLESFVPDGEGRPNGHALHIFKLGTKKDAELPTEVKSPELGPGKPKGTELG